MKKPPHATEPKPADRRRFLRDSVRGSVPLLLGLAGDSDPGADPAAHQTPEKPSSPPPEADSQAPAPAKTELDQIQEEFARNNPAMTEYPSQ